MHTTMLFHEIYLMQTIYAMLWRTIGNHALARKQRVVHVRKTYLIFIADTEGSLNEFLENVLNTTDNHVRASLFDVVGAVET